MELKAERSGDNPACGQNLIRCINIDRSPLTDLDVDHRQLACSDQLLCAFVPPESAQPFILHPRKNDGIAWNAPSHRAHDSRASGLSKFANQTVKGCNIKCRHIRKHHHDSIWFTLCGRLYLFSGNLDEIQRQSG